MSELAKENPGYNPEDVGELDWDTEVSSGRKFDYMKLQDGPNIVRVVSKPFRHFVHWIVAPDRSRKKVNCAMNGCPVCISGKAAKQRFIVEVLDRADNRVKLLDIGTEIYNGIKGLITNPAWGSIIGYDITIMKGKSGTRTSYGVTPSPKSALTELEVTTIKAAKEEIDLNKVVKPYTPERIMEVIKGTDGQGGDFRDDTFDASAFDADLEARVTAAAPAVEATPAATAPAVEATPVEAPAEASPAASSDNDELLEL